MGLGGLSRHWLPLLHLILAQHLLLIQPGDKCEAIHLPEHKQVDNGLYEPTTQETLVAHKPNDSSQGPEGAALDIDRGESRSLLARLSLAASLVIAPARGYYDLTQRYMSWRNKYNELRDKFGRDERNGKPVLRSAVDLLRIEYAKIDRQLAEDACQGLDVKMGHKTVRDGENVDLIKKILGLLIIRLEQRLEDLRTNGLAAVLDERTMRDDAEAEADIERLESSVQEAAGRVRRIATKAARGAARRELMRIAQLAILKLVASQVVRGNVMYDGELVGLMLMIEPIILLLANPNTHLVVDYLGGLRTRALFKFLKHSYSTLGCKRKKSLPMGPVTQAVTIDGRADIASSVMS